MKKSITATLSLLAFACAMAPAATPASETPEAITLAVNAVYDEMTRAAESLNVDALFQHVAETDTGAIVINGRLFMTRREALERTRTNFAGIRSIKYEVSDRHVTVLSATSALLVTTLTTHVETDDGRTFWRPSVLSIVFVFRDNSWKVVHSHQSNPPPIS